MPTRSLPGAYDVPRPFAPAPVTQCQVLHEAYGVALDATIMAARALDELALAARAPSKVLALARAAAPAQANQRGSQNRPNDDIPPVRLPARMPSWESRTFTDRAGPAEQAIRDRGISDPIILLRAAALDNAAWHLITRAENAASVPSPSDMPTGRRHAVGTPLSWLPRASRAIKPQNHRVSSHRAQPNGPSVQASALRADSDNCQRQPNLTPGDGTGSVFTRRPKITKPRSTG